MTYPVVVGVDQDQDSRVAIAAAFEFADRLSVQIVAVHAWTARRPAGGDVSLPAMTLWDRMEHDARLHLSQAIVLWTDLYPDVDVTEIVESDAPSKALLRWTQDAQLLVVGNRIAGRVTSVRVESIGLQLLRNSAVPVMLCHSAEGEQ